MACRLCAKCAAKLLLDSGVTPENTENSAPEQPEKQPDESGPGEGPRVDEAGKLLSQADLDALVAADQGESSPSEPVEGGGEGLLDQSPIDTPLTGEEAAATPSGEVPVPGGGEGPKRDAGPMPEIQLSQGDIDGLLTEADEDRPLDNQSLDALIDEAGGSRDAEETLGQAGVDDLIASLGESEGGGAVSQDTVDVLIASAGQEPQDVSEAPGADVGAEDLGDALVALVDAENEAAKKPAAPSEALLSQEDLDSLLREADEEQEAKDKAKQAALEAIGQPPAAAAEPIAAPPEARPAKAPKPWKWPFGKRAKRPVPKKLKALRVPSAVTLYVRDNFLKVSSSIAAMVVFTLATFTYLYTHQERPADMAAIAAHEGANLLRAMETARSLMAEGAYQEAIAELEKPIAKARPSPERTEALFLRLEAVCRVLPEDFTERQAEHVHAEIDELVEGAPLHPRTPQALRWKAELYERAGILYGAQDVYDEILASYGSAPNTDEVLMEAAKIAVKLNKPKGAAAYIQRLLRRFPGSPLAGEARLRLAGAFAEAGDPDDARVLYIRIAQSQAGTPVAAEAYACLGQLAYDQGRYEETIQLLDRCLEMATSVEGNDKVYLLLAKAYRATGQQAQARRVLNELIDFFPESEVGPEAYVELSQVLDELGLRKDAVRLATQTARRYPDNPDVLSNEAALLSLAGEPRAAGRSWLAAHEAGANDPEVLLAAARSFHKAATLEEAVDCYDRLRGRFPGSPQAFEGSIEQAEVKYELGRVREAIEGLEDLAVATMGKPQRLPVLMALGAMYQDLGFQERVAELFREVAKSSTEPEVLAQAATGLVKAGAADDGLAVADRVDVTKLTDATAYALLMAQGEMLLRVNPRRALDKMELAYEAYPDSRTPEGDQKLLDAYLATDNSARARALVMNLEAHVQRHEVDAPRLEKAAVAWGDYLYEKRDFRAAADAYARAIDAAVVDSADLPWAKYQRANALLKLSDFEGSVALYDEVAATDAPWAEDAGALAEYARLEQRVRGLPVTPLAREEG